VIGLEDLWIALALGVFFFGAKKLPELSRSVGQAMTEFKKGLATGGPEEPGPPSARPRFDGDESGDEGSRPRQGGRL